MWIRTVNISNFRCFDSFSITPNKDLNIIVGENSSGKSALFAGISKALSLGVGSDVFQSDDFRFGRMNESLTVHCDFVLDDEERFQVFEILVGSPASAELKDYVYPKFKPHLDSLKLACETHNGVGTAHLKLGSLFVRDNSLSYDGLVSGGLTSKIIDLVQDLIPDDRSLEQVITTKQLWQGDRLQRRLTDLVSERFRKFAEFRARPSTADRQRTLESFEGSNTASVLLTLKNHPDPAKRVIYEDIRSEFSVFFPYLSMEAVESHAGHADIQVIERGSEYPIKLDNVGAGVADLITMLTNLKARKSFMLVIEEPELHLHPHAKRHLHRLIIDTSVDNQVFLITHDAHFLDSEYISGIIRMWPAVSGTMAASISRATRPCELDKLRTAMKDPAKREMFFSRALLIVEDESQRNAILGFAKTLGHDLDGNTISVIAVDGEDGFGPYLELARRLEIPHICLRDKPWGSKKQWPPAQFRSLGCELEDFLRQNNLDLLMQEAKREVGTAKQRVSQYVGENTPKEQIPPLFSQLISDIKKLAAIREADQP